MKDKTEIIKVKGDWVEVVNDARATVGKEGLGKEPSEKFKRAILIAEHSPIRDLIVKWKWLAMPHGFRSIGFGISGRSLSELSAQTAPALTALNCRKTHRWTLLAKQCSSSYRHYA